MRRSPQAVRRRHQEGPDDRVLLRLADPGAARGHRHVQRQRRGRLLDLRQPAELGQDGRFRRPADRHRADHERRHRRRHRRRPLGAALAASKERTKARVTDPGLLIRCGGGRHWTRTSDLLHVKQVL